MSTHPPLIVPSRQSTSPALALVQATINAVATWRHPRRRGILRNAVPHDLLSDILSDNDLRPRGPQTERPYISGKGFV
jgi:hypothetical protein